MAVLSTHRPAAALALALTAAVLFGCAPAPEPSPTPTAIFASEEEAFAAAEEVYRAYIDAFNEVDLQDPATFEPVYEFSTGKYQASEKKSLSEMHADGYLRGGDIVVLSFEGVEVSDDVVRTRTCDDVSATTFTDSAGTSLVPADRPDTYALELTFDSSGAALVIASADPVKDDSCVAG